MKKIPYRDPTNIIYHRTECSLSGELVLGVVELRAKHQ